MLEVMEQLCGCLLYWCLGIWKGRKSFIAIGDYSRNEPKKTWKIPQMLPLVRETSPKKSWGVGVGIGEFFCLTPDGVWFKMPQKDHRTTEVGWVGQVHYLSHLSLFCYRNHPWQFTVLWLVENWNVWRFETGSRTSDIRDGAYIISTNN